MFSVSPLSIHTTAACDVIHFIHDYVSMATFMCIHMCVHACVPILCAVQYEAKECVLLFL